MIEKADSYQDSFLILISNESYFRLRLRFCEDICNKICCMLKKHNCVKNVLPTWLRIEVSNIKKMNVG